eukprot:9415499-Pyramimonas_sp.AAC.1
MVRPSSPACLPRRAIHAAPMRACARSLTPPTPALSPLFLRPPGPAAAPPPFGVSLSSRSALRAL